MAKYRKYRIGSKVTAGLLVFAMLSAAMITAPMLSAAQETDVPAPEEIALPDDVQEDAAEISAEAGISVLITAINPIPYKAPDDPNAHYISADKGTLFENIPFPQTLEATIEGGEADAYPITASGWILRTDAESDGGAAYDPDTPGTYIFVPVLALADNEILAGTAVLPELEVVVSADAPFVTMDADTPVVTDKTGANWIDAGIEYRYTTDAAFGAPGDPDTRIPTSAGSYTDLSAAISSLSTSGIAFDPDKPCVILINADFQFTSYITIADANVELRAQGGSYTLTPTVSTESASNADPTVAARGRHFYIKGTTCKLTLTNVTLDGQYDVNQSAATILSQTRVQGGILDDATTFYFNGKITRCAAISVSDWAGSSARYRGGGISLFNRSTVHTLYMTGGEVSYSISDCGGGIGTGNGTVEQVIDIGGDSVIKGNRTTTHEGAGLYLYVTANSSGGSADNARIIVHGNAQVIENHCTRGGGGIGLMGRGKVILEDNALIDGNTSAVHPIGSAATGYIGGAGVYIATIASPGYLELHDNATISNNVSALFGGGVMLGQTSTAAQAIATLYSGKICNNKASGIVRQTLGGNFELQKGSGGGITTINPKQNIIIPADSEVQFYGNTADYIALTDTQSLLTGNLAGFAGDDYSSHIQAPYSKTGNSALGSPYDNLYNGYDVGVPNNAAHNIYAELSLQSSPGAGGNITQSSAQLAGYTDVFGDGRFWKELNQADKLNFTAVAADGYIFNNWTYSSVPALTNAEWITAFGGTLPTSATISGFNMPDLKTTLTANFNTVANITKLEDHMFEKVWSAGYTAPDALAVPLINTGQTAATDVAISLSDFKKDDQIFASNPFDYTISALASVAANSTNASSLTIQPKTGLDMGAYTALVTLHYLDGAGNTVTKTSEVGFALYGDEPMILTISSEFNFGTLGAGYTPPSEPVRIYNYGNGNATITNIAITGTNASSFQLLPAGKITGTVAAHGSDLTTWTVSPKADLPGGEYHAKLLVTYGSGKTASKDIYVKTIGAGNVTAGNLVWTPVKEGYSVSPYQVITLSNSGDIAASIISIVANKNLTVANSSAYNVQTSTSVGVPAKAGDVNGSNTSWMIAPKKGLAPGNHLETFTITYNDGTGATKTSAFTAQFVVQEAGAPTGEITLNTNKWASFLNAITFGLFFEKSANTQTVTITAVDDTVNPPSISYYISDDELTSADALALPTGGTDGTDGWTAYPSGTGFDIEDSAGKKIIYALLQGDGTGKFSIINSAGIVVYENATATADVINHSKKTTDSKTATVNLSGNTIDKITNGAYTLIYGTDYTFIGNTITVTAAYLDTITTTPGTLTVHYKPQGETYVPAVPGTPSAGNEEPTTTNITVNITPGTNHWIDKGTEYVYTTNTTVPIGLDDRDPTPVTDYATLIAALNLVNEAGTGGYDVNKPYVVLLGNAISYTAAYTIAGGTGKNIELRSNTGTNLDLRCSTTGFVHFNVNGTIKLTLTDVALSGYYADDYQWASDLNNVTGTWKNSAKTGGITANAANTRLTFNGDIKNCYDTSYDGSAIKFAQANCYLEITGGKIHHNANYYHGGALGLQSSLTFLIHGDAEFYDNWAQYEGGVTNMGRGNGTAGTISGNVKMYNNHAGMGGAIQLIQNCTLDIKDNVEITNNVVYPNPVMASVYPGYGGGIYIGATSGTQRVNIYDNVKISGNKSTRGGAGITLGNQTSVQLWLYGGEITDNVTTGEFRYLRPDAPATESTAMGAGGGIFAYYPQNIHIPALDQNGKPNTVSFSGNKAAFAGRTNLATYTPWVSGEKYSDHIQKDFGQNTSTGFEAPYDNLYNNYDIGIANTAAHDIYAEIALSTAPPAGGAIIQTDEQLAGYTDVFGDGRFWKELNQGGGLKFIAEPADGYVFDRWSYDTIPALAPAEVTTALGGASATILANKEISAFKVPDVKSILVANFKTAANLNRPLDYVFEEEYDSGATPNYTQPAPWAVPLTNSGETGATNVRISITDPEKDGVAFGNAPTDLFTWNASAVSIAAGATDNTNLTIQPVAGLEQGAYTATLTLTYDDGSGKTVTKKSEIGFALFGDDPMILTISSDFEFGTQAEGYTLTPRDVNIYNYGKAVAAIDNIAIVGTNADSFKLTPSTATGSVPARSPSAAGANLGTWTVSPNAGLLSGDYNARLIVEYGSGLTAYKDIHLTVTGPAHLSAGNLSFEPKSQGYSTPPNYKPIAIVNSGDLSGQIQSIISDKGASSVYTVQGNSANVPAKVSGVNGANNSYLIAPKAGVAPGNNLETFTITYLDGSGGTAQTITFTAEFTVIEAGAPTGKITVTNNAWTSFLNAVTFGLFFKNTQDVKIEYLPTGETDIDNNVVVSYYVSNTVLTEAEVKALSTWTSLAQGTPDITIQIDPVSSQGKRIVYAKMENIAVGKSVILNTNGIVAYVDSAQPAGQNKSITRPEVISGGVMNDIAVTLNGNTMAKIVNTTKGDELTPTTHYTVNAGTGMITLTNAYLLTLAGSASPGTAYTFEVSYNPQGVTYPNAPLAGSQAPNTTNFSVTVSKSDQSALAINSSVTHTYGSSYTITTPAAGAANGGNGTGAVSYEVVSGGTGAGTISGSTLTISKAGTIILKATKAGDENYNPVSGANFTLTVGKAASTPNEPTGLTATYGDMLSSVSLGAFNTGPGKTSGTWTWNGTPGTTSVGTVAGSPVAHAATFTPTDTDNYSNFTGNYGITVAQKALTVNISSIANKHYDGLAAATANYGTPNILGIVSGDSNDASGVQLVTSAVAFTFDNASVGTGKTVTNTGSVFGLSGAKAANYSLTQPSGLTANITDGFTPVRGTHYQVTPLSAGSGGAAGWTNGAFTITAADGYAVSLTNTASGTWTVYPTALTISSAETAAGTVTFYVKRIGSDTGGIVQGEISVSRTETYKIDKTAPTAQIQYKTSGLRAFLNVVTFGRFFKDTVSVGIVGADTGSSAVPPANSGMAKTEYFATTAAYTQQQAETLLSGATIIWVDQAVTPLNITPAQKGKYHIFARLTDNAGNVRTYFDSAVIFEDSVQSGVSADYTKLTSDVTIDVNLKGNTVSGVVNTTHGGEALTASPGPSAQYSVNPSGGTGNLGSITMKSAYLDTLDAGTTYTFTVRYLPQGVDNSSAEAGSDAVLATTFTIRILKHSQTALSVTGISSPYTYGDASVTIGTSGGDGSGSVSYQITEPSVTGVASLTSAAANAATLNFLKPGTFRVRATKAGDANYEPTDVTTGVITINKAVPTLTLSVGGTGVYGDDVNLAASVVRVGIGAVPTGSVGFYVDGTLKSTVALDSDGKATYAASLLSAAAHSFEVRYLGNAYYKGCGASTADHDPAAFAAAGFTVGAAGQTIVLTNPGDKTWGDADIALSLSTSGSGTGLVTYSALPAGILNITGSKAEIIGVGTVTITANKAADGNHNGATDFVTIKVDKATPVWSVDAGGAGITYGKTLADSALSGQTVRGAAGGKYASTPVAGDVTWNAPAYVPDVSAIGGTPAGYAVTFTPTGTDALHYKALSGTANITVSKATPALKTALNATPILMDDGMIRDTLNDSIITGGTMNYTHGTQTLDVPGVWTWVAPGTSYNSAGMKTAAATFTPSDSSHFDMVGPVSISVTVYTPKTLVIKLPTVSEITYGDKIGFSLIDDTFALVEANDGTAGPHDVIVGTWTWTNGDDRASAINPPDGTYTAELTFTPDKLLLDPANPQPDHYLPTTADVKIKVKPADPKLKLVLPGTAVYGKPLSRVDLSNYTVEGVFINETLTGTLVWTYPNAVPSDSLTDSGGVGTYSAEVTFTPTGTFAPLYNEKHFFVEVQVVADTEALDELDEDVVTPLIPALHEENYTASDIAALKAALEAADVVRGTPGVTQTAVNAAYAILYAAYQIPQDHPVLEHTHPNGVTGTGESVTVRIKGYFYDVSSVRLGSAAYTLGPVDNAGSMPVRRILNTDGSTVGTITAGSAIVTFDASFIDALPNGVYPLDVTFVDNVGVGHSRRSDVANSEIRIERTSAPEEEDIVVGSGKGGGTGTNASTGDEMNLALWLVLAAAALAVLTALTILRRKQRIE